MQYLPYLKTFGKWISSTLFTTVVIVVLVLLLQKCPWFNPNAPRPTPAPVPAPQVDLLQQAWDADKDADKVLHRNQLAAFLEVAAQGYVPDPGVFKRRSDVFSLLHTAASHYLGENMIAERKVFAAQWLGMLKIDAELTEQDRKMIAAAFLQAASDLRKLK